MTYITHHIDEETYLQIMAALRTHIAKTEAAMLAEDMPHRIQYYTGVIKGLRMAVKEMER